MNNAPDPEDDLLLDAALADDDWQSLSATLKRQSLQTFRMRHVLRRSFRAGVALTTLLAITVIARRMERPSPSEVPPPAVAAALPAPAIPEITDEQLLAQFPKGTCAIAEINGRKQLIFFDQKQADQGFLVDAP
jgi:hypothetical protein